MPVEVDRDEQTLALRDAGQPFAAIAQILGLEDAHAANAGSIGRSGADPRPSRTGYAVAR